MYWTPQTRWNGSLTSQSKSRWRRSSESNLVKGKGWTSLSQMSTAWHSVKRTKKMKQRCLPRFTWYCLNINCTSISIQIFSFVFEAKVPRKIHMIWIGSPLPEKLWKGPASFSFLNPGDKHYHNHSLLNPGDQQNPYNQVRSGPSYSYHPILWLSKIRVLVVPSCNHVLSQSMLTFYISQAGW